ncbi:hypothetical protein [Paenibacillus sp. GXUN7292]|uniref:hypothetical protein n=1 Tax=Paenibacillus sp. GXUN7292 TaxID=3422499 RepID=UPI003D7D51A1
MNQHSLLKIEVEGYVIEEHIDEIIESTISISFLLLMMSVSTVFADIPEDFLGLGGGSKPETQKIEATDHGIIVSTEGSYTPDRQAAGIIYKKPIDPKDVTVEFTIDKISTLNPVQGAQWSQERDSWYAVSLLDKPDFWTTANDDVKSFYIGNIPY